jgi:hypothetical protein
MYPNVSQLETLHRTFVEAEELEAGRRAAAPRRRRRRFGLDWVRQP